MHTVDDSDGRELLLCALASLYDDDGDLIGFGEGAPVRGRALRANERAVGARLAVHVDRGLRTAGSALAVDVEYSRVLLGALQKQVPTPPVDGAESPGHFGQIFPDLIVHARGQTDMNLLVVEIKPGIPRRPDAVDASDARKLGHLTSDEWMSGQTAYRTGVCLQMAHNRARLHWYENGARVEADDWTPPVR